MVLTLFGFAVFRITKDAHLHFADICQKLSPRTPRWDHLVHFRMMSVTKHPSLKLKSASCVLLQWFPAPDTDVIWFDSISISFDIPKIYKRHTKYIQNARRRRTRRLALCIYLVYICKYSVYTNVLKCYEIIVFPAFPALSPQQHINRILPCIAIAASTEADGFSLLGRLPIFSDAVVAWPLRGCVRAEG